jgi:hypothetical protein
MTVERFQAGGQGDEHAESKSDGRTAWRDLVRRQCTLLNLARSGVYRPKPVPAADDLALMRRIDELHLELPFYGSRRMMFELNKERPGSTGSGCGG